MDEHTQHQPVDPGMPAEPASGEVAPADTPDKEETEQNERERMEEEATSDGQKLYDGGEIPRAGEPAFEPAADEQL